VIIIHAEIEIKGMHCPSCEMLIKDSLEDAGVKNIKISYVTGKAEIEFNENKIDIQKIKKIIKEEGYEV